MVSSAQTSQNKNDNDILMDMVVPKPEPAQDGHDSMSSSVSTPEAEAETLTQGVAQIQKRKGGRKPVCRFNSFVFFVLVKHVVGAWSCLIDLHPFHVTAD
jgi:hypothetical protein